MKQFDGNILDTFDNRSLLDHARKNKRFYSFRYLLAPWHHVLHIPVENEQDKTFEFNGNDKTSKISDINDKNKMWAIPFKEDEFM